MIIKSVGDLIGKRGLDAIGPALTLREACARLAEHDVGALAVLDGEGALCGILSERDIIRKAICRGLRMDDTAVAEVMTPDPVTIAAEASLAEAMTTMLDGGFRHLPVTAAGQVVAMLSMREIPTEYRLMVERYAEFRQAGPQAVG